MENKRSLKEDDKQAKILLGLLNGYCANVSTNKK